MNGVTDRIQDFTPQRGCDGAGQRRGIGNLAAHFDRPVGGKRGQKSRRLAEIAGGLQCSQPFGLEPHVPFPPVVIDMTVLDRFEQDFEMFQTVPVMRADGAFRGQGFGILGVAQAGEEDLAVRALVSLVALCLLTAGVVWQILLHMEEPERKVDGLLFALVVAVLAFALAFYRLEVAYPGQIPGISTRVDALYFTMTTLLTVGYGDINAQGQAARVLVMIAMVFNVAVIATAVTTISGRVRQRAEERAVERQERRTQRKPR